ncbi:MAG: ATP-binding protein [Nitrospinaceae bacterium]
MKKKESLSKEIAESRRTRKELRESEERYRVLFNQMRAIVAGTSSAITGEKFFQSLVCNLASALDVKYAFLSEIAGEDENMLRTLAFCGQGKIIDNIEYDSAGSPCERVTTRKIVFYSESVQSYFPDFPLLKQFKVESFLGVPLFHGGGKPLGVLAVMDDRPMEGSPNIELILSIFAARVETEVQRMRAEEALHEYNKKLIHSEKLSAIGKLIASIAHEINNPVYGIRNVLVRMTQKVPMEKRYRELGDKAILECNRTANLIQRLKDFYAPSSGKKVLVNIHEILDDALWWMRKEFRIHKIKLEKRYAQDLPKLEAVPDQLKQVILNLLQNAFQSLPEEGGTITLTTQVRNASIHIIIRDTGVGIDAKILSQIFEPFYTTKSQFKGTGLGLSVSYGIIKKVHRGDIQVESEPGQGTTVTICLPVRGED